jgi:hypothetical protein
MPKFSSGEIQLEIVAALKMLVKDFVNLRNHQCPDADAHRRGDWIYVLPFIHFWDSSEENFEEWLRLKEWKQNLQDT